MPVRTRVSPSLMRIAPVSNLLLFIFETYPHPTTLKLPDMPVTIGVIVKVTKLFSSIPKILAPKLTPTVS